MKSNQKLSILFWLFKAKATKDGKAPIFTKLKRIDPFTFGDRHNKTTIVLAKIIKGKKYLTSQDGIFIYKSWGDVDFSMAANVPGIEFEYNRRYNDWQMVNYNLYIQYY